MLSDTRCANRDRPAPSGVAIVAPPASSSSMPLGIQAGSASQGDSVNGAVPLVGPPPSNTRVPNPTARRAPEDHHSPYQRRIHQGPLVNTRVHQWNPNYLAPGSEEAATSLSPPHASVKTLNLQLIKITFNLLDRPWNAWRLLVVIMPLAFS